MVLMVKASVAVAGKTFACRASFVVVLITHHALLSMAAAEAFRMQRSTHDLIQVSAGPAQPIYKQA